MSVYIYICIHHLHIHDIYIYILYIYIYIYLPYIYIYQIYHIHIYISYIYIYIYIYIFCFTYNSRCPYHTISGLFHNRRRVGPGGRLLLTAPAVFDFQSLCSVLTVPGKAAVFAGSGALEDEWWFNGGFLIVVEC